MARNGPLVLISDPFRNTGNLMRSNSKKIYSSILLTWLIENRIKCIIAFCDFFYFGGQLSDHEGSPEKIKHQNPAIILHQWTNTPETMRHGVVFSLCCSFSISCASFSETENPTEKQQFKHNSRRYKSILI